MNTLQKLSVVASTAIVVLGVSTGSAQASNLVTNGDFNTGNFSGWTKSGNLSLLDVISNTNNLPGGSYHARFGSTGSPGIISQTLNTIAGRSYTLSFFLRESGSGANRSSVVSVGGNTLFSFLPPANNVPWTSYSSNFTATSASTLLSFSFRNDPSFTRLDNVSVTENLPPRPVPLPGVAFGVVAAGGALFAKQYKKSKAKQTVA
ncbi:MAG: DUF642 domain-containing protein [Pseudanabaenaceae cyanobacterium]|jgi:hypothetical protein